MSRNDDELRISDDDARFVQRLDALYHPPAPTAAERTRFAARLEQRIARGSRRAALAARRRRWPRPRRRWSSRCCRTGSPASA